SPPGRPPGSDALAPPPPPAPPSPADEPLGPQQTPPVRLEDVVDLPRVLPPPADDVMVDDLSMVDQVLDRVRDLELVPERRLDVVHRFEDGCVEHVHADEREVGARLLGLFDKPDDAVSVQ